MVNEAMILVLFVEKSDFIINFQGREGIKDEYDNITYYSRDSGGNSYSFCFQERI